MHTMSCFCFVQSLSCVLLFAATWTAARQASLSFTISWSLLRLTSIESAMLSKHLILCCPLLLPSVFRVFQYRSLFQRVRAPHIRWPKYWSFGFNISPSSEFSGLTSFRIDWFDLVLLRFLVYLFGCTRLHLWHMGFFSWGLWDLVPWPGIEPGSSALGVQSINH